MSEPIIYKSPLEGRERVTGASPTITIDHALIHNGQAFTTAGIMSILTAKTGAFFISVPAGVYCHFKAASIRSTAAVSVSFLEGYVKAGGDTVSALTPANRNRIRKTASVLTVTAGADVTPTTEATYATLTTASIGANLPAYRVGGDVQQAEEWVLEPGRNYCVAIANASGSTATVSYDLYWYEESGA